MNFKPTLDRLLVSRLEAETKTSSGFIIPDASVGKSNRGEVLAMGPGRINKDGVTIPISDIQVGDVVMFEGIGISVKVDGKDYIILKEQEVIAIVD